MFQNKRITIVAGMISQEKYITNMIPFSSPHPCDFQKLDRWLLTLYRKAFDARERKIQEIFKRESLTAVIDTLISESKEEIRS